MSRTRTIWLALLLPSLSFGQLPEEAVSLHKAGKLEEAVVQYREFLKTSPSSLPARSNLAVALANLGRLGEAITEYEKALEIDPDSLPVKMNLAIAYYKQQQIPSAGRLLETLHRAQPDNQQVLLLYLDCLLRLGEYGEVIQTATPFVEKNPDNLAANYLIGMAHLRNDEPSKGQIYIDRVMKGGGEAEALFLVGASQYEAGDYPAARDTLARAVRLNGELPGIHTYYAQALVETGDSDSAKASFLEALKRNPTDFEANLRYGALLRIEKQTSEASKYLRMAEKLNPRSLALQYQLANLDLETNNTAKAVPRLEEIVKQSPKYLEAHISLARAYYRLKRKEDGDRERAIIRKIEAENQSKDLKDK